MRWIDPHSRPAVKLRRALSRRASRQLSAARHLSLRRHVPWYWRAIGVLVVLIGLPVATAWLYGIGSSLGPGSRSAQIELAGLKDRISALEDDLARHRSSAQSAESTLQIERTTREQLAQQVRQLEEENARLKQDITLFESLADADGSTNEISISGLRVEPEKLPGRYRYTMLVVVRAARKEAREREFRGQLQLAVKMQQQGKGAILLLPTANDPKRANYSLSFRHFQRLEGSFQVPDGARVSGVEARLIQDGATRAAKTVNLG